MKTGLLAMVAVALLTACGAEQTNKPAPNTTVRTTYPAALPPGVGGGPSGTGDPAGMGGTGSGTGASMGTGSGSGSGMSTGTGSDPIAPEPAAVDAGPGK